MKTVKWLFLLSLTVAIPVLLAKVVKKHYEASETDRRYDINDYLTEAGL